MENLKNFERKTDKIEKKIKKISRKLKLIAIIVGIIGALTFTFLIFYNVSRWYDENKVIFQYPILIKLQTPIKIERRVAPQKKETRKEEAKNEQISLYPKGFEEAYDKVWLMESGRGNNKSGLNGYCITQGKINEIGYAPNDKYCFENQEEQKSTFMTWLTNRMNHIKMPYCNDVNQCVLIYSSGSYGLE
jgi:hypothetical protein